MRSRPLSLIDVAASRAAEHGAANLYQFLNDGSSIATMTFAELDYRARRIAVGLRRRVASGRPVALWFNPGLEFVEAFVGCLYAGIVAVPLYPPDSARPGAGVLRAAAIVGDARAEAILTTAAVASSQGGDAVVQGAFRALTWVALEECRDADAGAWSRPDIRSEALALLQYTSGSTGTPRGVMVTHQNLITNLGVIASAVGVTRESVVVSWLPMYHDMGLIGGVLEPLFVGGSAILMAPMEFLERPARWLQAITRYRGTIAVGPNFGFELCTRRVSDSERDALDLESMVAVCGAEPINDGTIDRFVEKFGPAGFRRERFYPCYGLAEATLFVTGGGRDAVPRTLCPSRPGETEERERGSRSIVSCGSVSPGHDLRVVDPKTGLLCEDGEVGEIWISGPSVAVGYWNAQEATARTFQARLLKTGEGPFLRTGDLGFVDGGELFVAGRLKDVIVCRGRNIYPEDIEAALYRCHRALRSGCGAAFGVARGLEERVVVVHEVDLRKNASLGDVLSAIRKRVLEADDVPLEAIVLIPPRTLPKTSSGKVQRGLCRTAYLDGSLTALAEWDSSWGMAGSDLVEQPDDYKRD